MLTCFTTITNGLISLGKLIDNDQKVQRIIRALSQAWKVKATILKELNDREEMDIIFMGNLKTHEIEMKAKKDREPQKKNGVALKVSPRNYKKKVLQVQLSQKMNSLSKGRT